MDEKAEELKVSISCRELTPEIEKILARLRILDRKCFLYTKEQVFQSDF